MRKPDHGFVPLLASCLLALTSSSALAGIHTWDVSEVFSNADGTIQFVELEESGTCGFPPGGGCNTEGGVGNGTISSDAKSFTWANGAVSGTADKFYLVATQGFADLPGAPTPDAIIPAGFLPNFFTPGGDSIDFGPYDTCTLTSAIPVDGVTSFNCVTNVTGVNSPSNFATGATGSVDASGAITLNYVDDFQGGTVQNWSGTSSPTNIATGGPAGLSDRYLQIAAVSNFLGAFNKTQWAGDYLAAGVDQVNVDLNNFGDDAVSVRIMVFTPGCNQGGGLCTAWTSTLATPLANDSGWSAVSFSLDEADLTRVLGSDSYATSLANIERVLIRHDDGTPSPPGTGVLVSATLGIDNVTATVPEPAVLSGLAAGAALVGALHRRRRASRT